MELLIANEASTRGKSAEVKLADRKNFVENLGMLLSQTRENIIGAVLIDYDTVDLMIQGTERVIHLHVNVACDSYMGIVRDVARALD